MQLTEVRIPVNMEAREIFSINVRALFDDEFRNEIARDAKTLARRLDIPDEILSNVKVTLPEKPSEEFQELLRAVLKDCVEKGLVELEKFEYSMADAQNYIGLVAALVVAVVVAVYLWLWVIP